MQMKTMAGAALSVPTLYDIGVNQLYLCHQWAH